MLIWFFKTSVSTRLSTIMLLSCLSLQSCEWVCSASAHVKFSYLKLPTTQKSLKLRNYLHGLMYLHYMWIGRTTSCIAIPTEGMVIKNRAKVIPNPLLKKPKHKPLQVLRVGGGCYFLTYCRHISFWSHRDQKKGAAYSIANNCKHSVSQLTHPGWNATSPACALLHHKAMI